MLRTLIASTALLFLSSWSHAQGLATQLTPTDLDYYLVQAFAASTAEQRHQLNHIGIRVQANAQAYIVTAVLEGYPAHAAGIQRGDRLISVNKQPYHPVTSFNYTEQ
jgi:C-terminal processing protease CtpA/Prc